MYKLPPLLHLAAAWVVVGLGFILVAVLLVTFWLQILKFIFFVASIAIALILFEIAFR